MLISIHAPRMGRDNLGLANDRISELFQSTRPVWGATISRGAVSVFTEFQSTRPVWGATIKAWRKGIHDAISIHAPRMGRDEEPDQQYAALLNFNPRAPYGARPRTPTFFDFTAAISIHAPRMGRDFLRWMSRR